MKKTVVLIVALLMAAGLYLSKPTCVNIGKGMH